MGARGALAIQRGATMGQAVGETTEGIKRIEGAIARVAQGALQDHDDWRVAATRLRLSRPAAAHA